MSIHSNIVKTTLLAAAVIAANFSSGNAAEEASNAPETHVGSTQKTTPRISARGIPSGSNPTRSSLTLSSGNRRSNQNTPLSDSEKQQIKNAIDRIIIKGEQIENIELQDKFTRAVYNMSKDQEIVFNHGYRNPDDKELTYSQRSQFLKFMIDTITDAIPAEKANRNIQGVGRLSKVTAHMVDTYSRFLYMYDANAQARMSRASNSTSNRVRAVPTRSFRAGNGNAYHNESNGK